MKMPYQTDLFRSTVRSMARIPSMLFLILACCLTALPVAAQQTFTVTTSADSGAGSLRDAIAQANATPETDQIIFTIDGGGKYAEIFFASNIVITAPVEIDGHTQGCDLSEGLCVRLDGGRAVGGFRLFTGSDGSLISGLAFTRFGAAPVFGAIEILSSDNDIVGNYFGTDRTGLVTDPDGMPDNGDELGNVFSSIVIKDNLDGATFTVENNRIGSSEDEGANVFGGGGENGIIQIGAGASATTIQGNFFGVGHDGETLLGNGFQGIAMALNTHSNMIGGTEDGEGNLIMASQRLGILLDETNDNTIAGNVISGNEFGGITIQNNAMSNFVRDNNIGTTADGMAALPNGTLPNLAGFGGFGVQILSGSQFNFVENNLISGNLLAGVIVGGFDEGEIIGNSIQDNLIGLDENGDGAIPNGVPGIAETGAGIVFFGHVTDVRLNLIKDNYISGNTTAGILLDGPLTTDNPIWGNFIGIGEDDETPLPNGQAGILIRNGSHANQIGAAGESRNAILFNPVSIAVAPNAGMGNDFANNFFGAAAFDVDLGLDGPTANDTGDADEGPNRFQNHADVAAINVDQSVLTVTFRVETDPANAAYPLRLQLYSPATVDGVTALVPLGETLTYEAQDAQTFVTQQLTLSAEEQQIALQQFTTIVIDADGNASEFSLTPLSVATEDGPTVPQGFVLEQNYPNPFNPATRIAYEVPEGSHVRLEVFDVLGRRVALLADGPQPAGRYEVTFEGASLPSGTYLYRLQAGASEQRRSMILLK